MKRMLAVAGLVALALSAAGAALADVRLRGFLEPGETRVYSIYLPGGREWKAEIEGRDDVVFRMQVLEEGPDGWYAFRQRRGEEDFDLEFRSRYPGEYRIAVTNLSYRPSNFRLVVERD